MLIMRKDSRQLLLQIQSKASMGGFCACALLGELGVILGNLNACMTLDM